MTSPTLTDLWNQERQSAKSLCVFREDRFRLEDRGLDGADRRGPRCCQTSELRCSASPLHADEVERHELSETTAIVVVETVAEHELETMRGGRQICVRRVALD